MSGSSESVTSPARALLGAVRACLDERCPYRNVSPGVLPPGLRVEMHPRVHYTLAADPETYAWPRQPGDSFEEIYTRTFGVPVKITSDMPEGHWRLVVVTEEVLLGGGLQSAPTPTT